MTTNVEIHLHETDAPIQTRWWGRKKDVALGYGVIDLGATRLFVDGTTLDRLATALDLLIRERDETEGQ